LLSHFNDTLTTHGPRTATGRAREEIITISIKLVMLRTGVPVYQGPYERPNWQYWLLAILDIYCVQWLLFSLAFLS